MPSIHVRGMDDMCLGTTEQDGSVPLIGDDIHIGMPHNYRGTWRVVGREHRVTGPRCTLAILYVEPVDETATSIVDAEKNKWR